MPAHDHQDAAASGAARARGKRILIDTGRNGYSATFAAAYAVRARPGAPVSAPCTWDEIEAGAEDAEEIEHLLLEEVLARLESDGDIFGDQLDG